MGGIDPTPRQQLTLLLVAGRHHLSSGDLRSLIQFLEQEDCGFDVTLQVADPVEHPELLELHRLVVTPALVKLQPMPKQVFAGTSIFQQLRGWMPRWQQDEVVSGLGLSLKPTELDGSRTQSELQLEDQLLVLRQENETLIDRLQSQERLLRMVAHELRTPLTAATLALQSQQLGQIDLNRFHDVLKRRLDEIALLSKDLLEVGSTRWEALFNPQRLDLASIAAEAILELEKLWLGRDLTINTDIPADLPLVFADQSFGERTQIHPGRRHDCTGHGASHQSVGAGEYQRQRSWHPRSRTATHFFGPCAAASNLWRNIGIRSWTFGLPTNR